MMLELNHLLNIKEVSTLLSVPISTLRSWMYQGKIPFLKFGKGRRSIVRFHPERILEWLGQLQTDAKQPSTQPSKNSSPVKGSGGKKRTDDSFDQFARCLLKKSADHVEKEV